MGMKRTTAILMFTLMSGMLSAQSDFYYKRISLKSNVFSPVGIGIEFPIKDALTVEYSVRKMRTGILNKNVYKDERLHLKYHWPIQGLMDKKTSVYVLAGIHGKYQTLQRKIRPDGGFENGYLEQNRFVYGLGFQAKRFDVWLAAERIIYERDNSYSITDANGKITSMNYWKSGGHFSMGLSFVLFNFRK